MRNRYGIRFTEDLEDWFDRDVWRRTTGCEFAHPIPPESLLSDAPEFVWPGFMLPDSLPLVGNRYGDWLCLRVGPDNDVAEVIHWFHGGGDWIPWGRTLAESISFDYLRTRLAGRRQYYANTVSEFKQIRDAGSIPGWAAEHLPIEISRLLVENGEATNELPGLMGQLIAHDVSQIAVRCEGILNALDSPMRTMLDPSIAHDLGFDWDSEAVRWMFDNDLAPPSAMSKLAEFLGYEQSQLLRQDWGVASEHAQAVASQRDDLSWAHEIIGWGAERRHDYEGATRAYRRAALGSCFADQSVRFRTHWYSESEGKFSTARLQHLMSLSSNPVTQDPYIQLFIESKEQSLRSRVANYWTREAQQAESQSQWSIAYDAYYRAGWDLGSDDLAVYEHILNKMVETARRAGQDARAAVASTHLACLVSRLR